LERNLNSFYYERLLSSQQTAEATAVRSASETVHDFIKDPYVFEFLNIPEPYATTERGLESALINHLQHFLLELGKGFSFVGRQFRISTETSHFYIDLVFYNYILKCFVLFDLKTSKLKHQDIGQMDMYIRMFDDLKKQPDDHPTIGIILCADKEETVVKYSMLNDSEQMFASQYRLYLPTEAELKQLLENDRIVFALNQADQGGQL
jgi:predicted nuclease of restriction endonuclease-like (RecB) superfamily